jgi:gliding motility-associated-like protein
VSIREEYAIMKYLIIALLILLAGYADAQTCTGGLGDPIADITFGSGTGFGGPLAAGITNMTYVASQCPNDGSYTIVNSTANCFSNTWLNVPHDHTGDPNGYFMLINASFQPSVFYTQTINGLCPGTSYQFAAWVLNMDDVQGLIESNLTFTISTTSGTVLQTYSTGNIAASSSVNWLQYAVYFNTPAGVSSVVLQIINNASGGDGNDLALDDITFRAAGPATQASVVGYTSDSVIFCQSNTQPLTFNATVESCYATTVYQWQESTDGGTTWTDITGATGLSYSWSGTSTGGYQYRLNVAQAGNIGNSTCEVSSSPIGITIVPTPSPAVSITASADSSCMGSPVTFTATPDSGGASPIYQWMVDGVNSGSGGATYSSSSLTSSDVVSCTMTSDATCVLTPVVVSNDLSLVVTAIPVTGVSIASSAQSICQDSGVVFTATPSNGGGDPTYQWTVNGQGTGPDAPVFTDSLLNSGDVVNCTMTGSLLCSLPVASPQPITMTIYPLPVISLTADTVIAGGASLQLDPVITGTISSYQWSPATGLDNPAVADPVATPEGTSTYSLLVISPEGCKASASEIVGVFYSLQMPNAFTPNGDGRNDLFRVPPSVPVSIRQLAVYNRQGLLVFSTSNVSVGWDGTFNGHPQPAGVYVWELVYDNPLTKRTASAKGTVVLVR